MPAKFQKGQELWRARIQLVQHDTQRTRILDHCRKIMLSQVEDYGHRRRIADKMKITEAYINMLLAGKKPLSLKRIMDFENAIEALKQ